MHTFSELCWGSITIGARYGVQKKVQRGFHSYALKFCIHGTYSTILMFSSFATQHCNWWVFLQVDTNTTKLERKKISIEPPWNSLTHTCTFQTIGVSFSSPFTRSSFRSTGFRIISWLQNRYDRFTISKSVDWSWIPELFFIDRPTIPMELKTTAPTSRKRRSWNSSSHYPGYKNWAPICNGNRAS